MSGEGTLHVFFCLQTLLCLWRLAAQIFGDLSSPCGLGQRLIPFSAARNTPHYFQLVCPQNRGCGSTRSDVRPPPFPGRASQKRGMLPGYASKPKFAVFSPAQGLLLVRQMRSFWHECVLHRPCDFFLFLCFCYRCGIAPLAPSGATAVLVARLCQTSIPPVKKRELSRPCRSTLLSERLKYVPGMPLYARRRLASFVGTSLTTHVWQKNFVKIASFWKVEFGII